MNSILQDIRHGFRILARNPGLSLIALLTLGLGIGLNAAIFSVSHAMHVRPMALHDPDRLIQVWGANDEEPTGGYIAVSALDFQDWREQAQSFSEMGIFRQTGCILTGASEPEHIKIAEVDSGLLPMLGVTPRLGRLHTSAEDAVDADRVVLLSDGFWQSHFGGRADVLGEILYLNEQPHRVVGVLPPIMDRLRLWYNVNAFTPLSIDPAALKRGQRDCQVIARLKPGFTAEQAETELRGIAQRLATAYPGTNAKTSVWIQPLMDFFTPWEEKVMEAGLLVAVGIVLFVACVNLANLMLAKASVRRREFAVRIALGAGRGRIVRQLLTESLLLAVLGGALGLLLGLWAVDLLIALTGAPFYHNEIGLNPSIFCYALALSAAAALVFGLTPALLASRVSLNQALKEGVAAVTGGTQRNRLRNLLVVGQLAIAVPLLISSGLISRNLQSLKSAELGFNPSGLLTFRVELPTNRYEQSAQKTEFFREMLGRIEALPGVNSAAAVSNLPLQGTMMTELGLEGRPVDPDHPLMTIFNRVSPDWFAAMEIPLLSGRTFTAEDTAEATSVAIVDRKFADAYWPGESPIGKQIRLGDDESWSTIVGVVGNARTHGFEYPPEPQAYVPYEQDPSLRMAVAVKTGANPLNLAAGVRGVLRELDANLPVFELTTMAAYIEHRLNDERILAWFLFGLSLLTLSLAGVGLYGVLSYSVAQRTHEIGVRVALGADRGSILRMVLTSCLRVSALGIAIGLVLSIPISMAISTQLVDIGWLDPITFIGVTIVLTIITLAAGYLPARRATRISPITALRYE